MIPPHSTRDVLPLPWVHNIYFLFVTFFIFPLPFLSLSLELQEFLIMGEIDQVPKPDEG